VLNWLQQQVAVLEAWVTGHQASVQTGVTQRGAGLQTWVPAHPIETLVVGVALIVLLRLLPGPRRRD
jgi:hypothetical protein